MVIMETLGLIILGLILLGTFTALLEWDLRRAKTMFRKRMYGGIRQFRRLRYGLSIFGVLMLFAIESIHGATGNPSFLYGALGRDAGPFYHLIYLIFLCNSLCLFYFYSHRNWYVCRSPANEKPRRASGDSG